MALWDKKKTPPPSVRRALVLGGGGSKGAYQIGIWQAFRELGVSFQVITGTSVGALNGALMTQGDFQAAYDLWRNLDNSQVMEDVPKAEDHPGDGAAVVRAYVRGAVKGGGLDPAPLEKLVRGLLDEKKLRASGITFGMITVDMTTLEPRELFLEDIPEGSVPDYLMASASLFPVMRPKTIGNRQYIDGGYYDNIPIALALRADPAVDEILVVDVDGPGLHREVKTDVPVATLRSYWDLGSLMIFEQTRIRRNIKLGYLDGLKHFQRLEGRAYAFAPGETLRLEEDFLEEMTVALGQALENLPKSFRLRLDRLVTDRLTGAVSHRRQVATPGQMLLAAAETAGELLDLDPTRVYTIEEFNSLVMENLARQKERNGERRFSLEELKGLPIPDLVQGVRAANREWVLLAVLDNLRQHLTGGDAIISPEAMALFAPREFVAALYLALLERHAL